jgi:uncharacterized protein YjbI with pentapeptide repeats
VGGHIRLTFALAMLGLLIVIAAGDSNGPLKVVQASEILTKIVEHKPVNYTGVTIEGDLNFNNGYVNIGKFINIRLGSKMGPRSKILGECSCSEGRDTNSTLINSMITNHIVKRVNNSLIQVPLFLNNSTLVSSPIMIRDSIIKGVVQFNKTTFQEPVIITNTTFCRDAYFANSNFSNSSYFSNSSFVFANFALSNFGIYANFENTKFRGSAAFPGAKFTGYANFEGAQFGGYADFFAARFVVLISFFGFIFWGRKGIRAESNSSGKVSLEDAFCHSLMVIIGASTDLKPVGRYRYLVALERIFGWLLLALFITTLGHVMIR